jgi:hypothetical protein
MIQEVMLYFARPGKAAFVLESLLRRNPWLAEVRAAIDADTEPEAPKLLHADRILTRYFGTMLASRFLSAKRQHPGTVPLEDPDTVHVPASIEMSERRPEVFDILDKAADSVASTLPPREEAAFRQAHDQVLLLSTGEAEMETLTQATVDADDGLRSMDPSDARVTARNRLQQRHKRARDRLKSGIRQLEVRGEITTDEMAEALVLVDHLLTRRQIPAKVSVNQGKTS